MKSNQIKTKRRVYIITSPNTQKCYIGSTLEHLTKRLYTHEENYRRFLLSGTRYCSSFEIIKLGNYSIKQLDILCNATKKEILDREQYFINIYDCVNIQTASKSIRKPICNKVK